MARTNSYENDVSVFTQSVSAELANDLFNALLDCLNLVRMYRLPLERMEEEAIEAIVTRAEQVRKRAQKVSGKPFA